MLALGAAVPPATAAGAKFRTGLADLKFQVPDDSTRTRWLDQGVSAGSDITRISLSWDDVAPSRPTFPANPDDPAYQWYRPVDEAIRDAVARGQRVLLLVAYAPDWAEGSDPPPHAQDGTWKPSANDFRDFATALATRYSGRHVDISGPLPRVDYFQVWGEPNLELNLAPQWSAGKRPLSPEIYRDLVTAFYEGVERAGSGTQVIAGGTSPYGDGPGGARMRPLLFLRRFLCLEGRRRLDKANCGSEPRFDIFGHNPINTTAGPYRDARHPDDAATSDFGEVRRMLRAGERRNVIPGRHPLWALELWWETKPPDETFGTATPRVQARWLQQAFYVLWRQGASAAIWLQVADDPIDPGTAGRNETYQSGLLYADGSQKPSFGAFRFPFVVSPFAKGRTVVWTVPPTGGNLRVERLRGGTWKSVENVSVRSGVPEQIRLPVRKRAAFRAVLNGESSLSDRG